ncbi:hypothetical protein F5Y10DRAFT_234847 [Nemania abortiva]|nr:hypothetical protein F5Y10DRAFT_234847 [Nemania abortiva]
MSLELDHGSSPVAARGFDAVADNASRLNATIDAAVATMTKKLNAAVKNFRDDMEIAIDGVDSLQTEISTAIGSLRDEIQANITGSRYEMQGILREEMQKIERRLEDIDYNSRARAFNCTARRQETIIRPLKNITTHQVVVLPETVGHLMALQTDETERYLEALGQVPAGTAEEKHTQLIEYIGLGFI